MKWKKIKIPSDCHGCIYYNAYGDYCTQKGVICHFKPLEEVYSKKHKKNTQ